MSDNKKVKRNLRAELGTAPVGSLMLRFSVPAIIAGIVSATYNIIDQIFIGQWIGELGMAATNIAFPLTTITMGLSMLFGVGGASNFNLNMGRGKPELASKVAGNALVWMILSGLIIVAIAFTFLRPLLYAFGATDAIMPYAVSYTSITTIGLPFHLFATSSSNLIRADGSPTYSMAVMLTGAIFHLISAPIFLLVFNMGIEGIALSTTIGQCLSFSVALYYILRKFKTVPIKREHLKIKIDITWLIVSIGAASCFNHIAMTVVQIVKSNTLRHYGALTIYGAEIPLAAVGAISKILLVMMVFIQGIAQGSQPINSYNYGAKNFARVKQTYKKAIFAATIVSVVAFLCLQLFPRQIMSIFGSDNELFYEFAIQYLRIFMLMTFINGVQPVTSNFFTAIGKGYMGFWMSLTRQILFLTPLLIFLPSIFGIEGIFWAGPIADAVAAALAIIFGYREMKKLTLLQQLEEENALDI